MGSPSYQIAVGTKFGRLEVIEDLRNGNCSVRCACGVVKDVKKTFLKNGRVVSCGCWNREKSTKHGMEGTRVYNTWASMLTRCRNPDNVWFHRYGGRGITVSESWLDFKNFYADMGDKPEKASIERIDNDGPYCKENCRWATHTEQMRNRQKTTKVEYDGKLISVTELAEMHNLRAKTVAARLKSGMSVEDALSKTRHGRWGPTKSKIVS